MLSKALWKIPSFHLISWCGNFVERHSFHIVLGELCETMWKLCLSTNFHTRKLGEIAVFFGVKFSENSCFFMYLDVNYSARSVGERLFAEVDKLNWSIPFYWYKELEYVTLTPKTMQKNK